MNRNQKTLLFLMVVWAGSLITSYSLPKESIGFTPQNLVEKIKLIILIINGIVIIPLGVYYKKCSKTK